MAKLQLPVILEQDEDGYFIVSCPLFKGCHSYGKTVEEAMENIKEVIEMCLEELDEEEKQKLNRFVGLLELEVSA